MQHARVRKQGLSAERDETDVSRGLDKCILFLQREEGLVGLTAGDGCPTSHQCRVGRQRWGETCLGWNEGDEEKQMWPPSLPSPRLNKSCSRSFYLHMLTGTSEFPEERSREKKDGERKNRERDRAVPIAAAKGLSGLFSSHGVILIKPCSSDSLFRIHTHTEREKVQEGDEID